MTVARPDDVAALVALRDLLARWLLSLGVRQWLPGEFSVHRMSNWVDKSWVHVHRIEDDIAAAVAVLPSDTAIWPEDGDAGYIHLLMVARKHAGRGLGDGVLAEAERMIAGSDRSHSRLDVVSVNPALHQWYVDRGYAPVGVKTFDGSDMFDTTLFQNVCRAGSRRWIHDPSQEQHRPGRDMADGIQERAVGPDGQVWLTGSGFLEPQCGCGRGDRPLLVDFNVGGMDGGGQRDLLGDTGIVVGKDAVDTQTAFDQPLQVGAGGRGKPWQIQIHGLVGDARIDLVQQPLGQLLLHVVERAVVRDDDGHRQFVTAVGQLGGHVALALHRRAEQFSVVHQGHCRGGVVQQSEGGSVVGYLPNGVAHFASRYRALTRTSTLAGVMNTWGRSSGIRSRVC